MTGDEQQVGALSPANAWSPAKAVLAGFAVFLFLFVVIPIGVTPFWLCLSLISWTAVTVVDAGITSLVPWLAYLFLAATTAVGGYVAAAYVPRRKVMVGFMLAAVIASTSVPFRLLSSEDYWSRLLGVLYTVVCLVVFPALGAHAEKAWFPRRTPMHLLRRAWLISAYAAFPWGVLLPLVAVLVRKFYPVAQTAEEAIYYNLKSTPISAYAFWVPFVAGALLTGHGLFTFVKSKGVRRGLVRNWYVYLTLSAMLAFILGFVHRDSANRARPFLEYERAEQQDSGFDFSDSSNGAVLYMQAAMLMSGAGPPQALSASLRWSDAVSPEVTEWLAAQQGAIELAVSAIGRASVRFPYSWSWEERGWSLAGVPRLALALKVKSLVVARNEGIREATKYVDGILEIAGGLSFQGMEHLIVGARCTDGAIEAMREMLRMPGLRKDDLEVLASKLAELSNAVLPLRDAWDNVVESDAGYEFEDLLCRLRTKSGVSYLISQFVPKTVLLQVRHSVVHQVLQSPSWLDMMRGFHHLEVRGINLVYDATAAPFIGEAQRRLQGVTRMLGFPYEKQIRAILSQQARLRLLQALAAVRLFQFSSGKLPVSWDDLVPEHLASVPLDPFCGDSMKLTVREGRVLIYSIGENQEDDAGEGFFDAEEYSKFREMYHGERPWADDIVLTWPEEPARPSGTAE
jgi:hypothetical protein